MVTRESPEIEIQAQWMLDESAVPAAVNQFMLQPAAPLQSGAIDGVYLTIGHLNPPQILGYAGPLTPESVEGRLFPVVPVARVLVSVPRLRELRDGINEFLKHTEGREAS